MRSMSSGAQISEHHSFLVWPWATSPSWDWISSSVKGEWHLPPPWRVVRSEQDNSCHVLVSAPTHGNYSSLLELNSAKFGFQLLFTLHPFSSFFFFFLIMRCLSHPIIQTSFLRLISVSPFFPLLSKPTLRLRLYHYLWLFQFFSFLVCLSVFSVTSFRDDNPFIV